MGLRGRGSVVLCVLFVTGGCVGEPGDRPGSIGGGGDGRPLGLDTDPIQGGTDEDPFAGGGECSDGDQRDCHVNISSGSGAPNCFTSTQTCLGGEWGPCGGPGESDGAVPAAAGALSVPSSSSSACAANQCNAQCVGFTEVPVAPVAPSCVGVASGPPAPLSYSQTYEIACPAGTRGVWDLFAFDADTPTGTSVSYAVSTSDTLAGTYSTPVSIATAPTDHPADCLMTGPSPCGGSYPGTCTCPIDLYSALGSTDAEQQVLKVDITLTQTTSCVGAPSSTQGTPVNGITDCNAGAKNSGTPTTACNATNQYTKCGQDFHCNLVTGNCEWNMLTPNYTDAGCSGNGGVDLTVNSSCYDGVNYHTAVCNRGTSALAASVVSPKTIELWKDQGVGAFNPCSMSGPSIVFACSQVLTSPLAAGACVDFVNCDVGVGNRFFAVNPFNTIPECGWGAGTGAGCNNNGAGQRSNGGTCPELCGAPTGGSPPSLEGWDITYSCFDSE